MTGKEIRFRSNGAEAVFREGEKLKFEGKGNKKNLKKLKPIFDAILRADETKGKKKNKLDSQKEIELMGKLQDLLMADGVVKADEAALGDEFKKSKKDIETFINEKLDAAKKVETPKIETKVREEKTVNVKNESKPAIQAPVSESQSTAEEVTPKAVQQRPDKRVSARAFNQAIQNLSAKFANRKAELEAQFTQDRPIKRGDTLYKIAKDSLGKPNPSVTEINARIAEIALVNNLDDVNNVKIPSIKVPAGTPGANTLPDVKNGNEVSSISITKPIDEVLTEQGYTKGENKTETADEQSLTYNKWTKEGDETAVYTSNINNVTISANSLDELKTKIENFNNASTLTTTPADEKPEGKIEREKANLEKIKKQIELTNGDINVIKNVIDELRDTNKFDLKTPEVQTFVQELIKTKNLDVLTKILNTNNELDLTLLGETKASAETVAAIYKELCAKENFGTKLTDTEIELKDFFKSKIDGQILHIDNSMAMKFNAERGEAEYIELVPDSFAASSPEKLKEFLTKLEAIDEIKADSNIANDTDEAAQARAKQALFREYAKTEDKALAESLARKANEFGVSKEDILTLINNNGMNVLAALNFKPASSDEKAFNNAVADRVIEIYKSGNGEKANLKYLDTAISLIMSTDKPEEDKLKLKEQIIDSFFNKTQAGYEFKQTRRPTYEEMDKLVYYTNQEQSKAILASVQSLDDLGKGQYTQVLETLDSYITTDMLKAKYTELFEAANLDIAKDPEGAKKKVLKFIDDVGENIDLVPFDKIKEKFDGNVDFVKEHLGALQSDNTIRRKLTSLDINVVKDGDKYKTEFAIGPNYGGEDSQIILTGATEDEVLKKAEKYIRVQNISYENINPGFTSTEVLNNSEELEALFDEGDSNLQEAIAYVAVFMSGIQSNTLIDKMIETKKAGIANHAYLQANEEQTQKLINLVLEGGEDGRLKANTPHGAELVEKLLYKADNEQLTKLYEQAGKTLKIKILNKINPENYSACIKDLAPLTAEQMKLVDNSKMGSKQIVKSGDSLYNLVRDYMLNNFKTNPNIFPQLKTSAENNPSKWTEARLKEALNDYWKDFGNDIMSDLGYENATQLKAGQIIDFDEINWTKHQPNWLNYNMLY